MKKKIADNEIDFVETFITILNDKFKIILIALITVIIAFGITTVNKQYFKATTKIKLISIFEENLYKSFNSIIPKESGLNKINKDYLLNLFLEELRAGDITQEAFKKFEIIDRKQYNTEDSYLKAVEKEVLKINILRPINVDENKKAKIKPDWTIEYQVDNENKWELALNYINSEINKKIKNYLSIMFDVSLNNLKLIKKFQIEDLDLQISNVKNDYEIETANRLAFLIEQALIARELNIENNTLEAQNFNSGSSVISNIKTSNPYYMRGYKMIEKEIKLIKSRNNKDAFTKNLFDLVKQKRDLEEDKTLYRTELLFSNTPIKTKFDFMAAKIVYNNTRFESSYSQIKVLVLAAVIGLTFGVIYVLVNSAIRKRKL